MVQRIWFRIAPYWHILTSLCAGVILVIYWVHDVSAYGPDIEKLKATAASQATSLAVISDEIHETRDQVHDIWQAMRLDQRKK